MHRLVHAIAIALVLLSSLGGTSPALAQSSTLVFLVRHAERAAQPANDPGLTPEGDVRARALAGVLGTANITAIITTQFARTKLTAAPLAARLGLTPEIVGTISGTASDSAAQAFAIGAHARLVADAVRKHAGGAVLVVGHSNTIPAIATALGAPKLPDLCDGDYDQLFVLELPASGPPRFVRTRYGALAADAKCAPMVSR